MPLRRNPLFSQRTFLPQLCMVLLFQALAATAAQPVPPPRFDVPGLHFPIHAGHTTATLYVPAYYNPARAPGTEVLVFIHGAAWVTEQEFYRASRNAVLLSVTQPRVGWGPAMQGGGVLLDLLNQTTQTLATAQITTRPLTRVAIASFSGGYSGVHELLAAPATAPLISDVVLADSLYPPHPALNSSDILTTTLTPILDFARRAATTARQPAPAPPTFWLSQLYPPEAVYRTNTTSVASAWLMDQLHVPQVADGHTSSSRGASILYRGERNGFHVLGYAGMTTQDHFEHFYGIGDLIAGTGLAEFPGHPSLANLPRHTTATVTSATPPAAHQP